MAELLRKGCDFENGNGNGVKHTTTLLVGYTGS
jgi:hypothetical protein